MARARKRHVQLELAQFDKNGQRRGGARKGAGRPKKGERASERHKTREAFRPSEPVHVTIRVVAGVSTLRDRDMYKALRDALVVTYAKSLIRVVHISIQGTHVHLLVETANRMTLARGMQSFEIAAAKNINAVMSKRLGRRRKGQVFADRYHAVIIRTPRQARSNLAYVLNNWRRHGESQLVVAHKHGWRVDPFSTAPSFQGWKDVDASSLLWPETYLRLPAWQPKTWLLREGWKKHGLLRTTEVPGPRFKATART